MNQPLTSVEREIASGRLARVVVSRTAQGMPVAIKRFHRQPTSDSFARDRRLRAAVVRQQFTGDGLVRHIEVDPQEGLIVMPLMPQSVAGRMREGPADPTFVWKTLHRALRALDALHSQGFVHANVKPSNVFFNSDMNVELGDGLLVSTANPETLPPPLGLKYLSPEQTNDAWGPISPATDLYCLGFIALELLAGNRFGSAFQGVGDRASEEDIGWFQWHASGDSAPGADRFHRGSPPELVELLAKLLNKDPRNRFASAAQALAALPANPPGVNQPEPAQPTAPRSQAHQASASHIAPRPRTGTVLRVACGPRAGEMFGTDEDRIMIGVGADCALAFSNEEYPHLRSRVILSRTSEGWTARRETGDAVFVNQEELDESLPLRSGDILRLSPRGPDIQFMLQGTGIGLEELVARLLVDHGRAGRAPSGKGQRSAVAVSPAPRPPASAPASPPPPHEKPMAARPVPAAAGPAMAAAPAPPARPAPPVAHAAPVAPAPRAAPAPPAARVAGAPEGVAQARGNGAAQAVAGREAHRGKFDWFSPKSWTKNQKNTAIAIVGALIVILAVYFFPSSPPSNSTESPAAGVTDPNAASNPNPNPNPNANANANANSPSEASESSSEGN